MNAQILINLAYIASAVIFIYGIKMLGSAATARKGNLVSSVGMLIAVVVTLLNSDILAGNYLWIVIGLLAGAAIGGLAAKLVKMTGMPELVALFNGFGGLASVLVGWAEYERIIRRGMGWEAYLEQSGGNPYFTSSVIILAILIGGITFTGSLLAYGKLAEIIAGKARVFPGQKALNGVLAVVILILGAVFAARYNDLYLAHRLIVVIIALSLLLGVSGVLPIGGGDMPVVISLLNSCSGLAAAMAGFVIVNNVLIVAGCLVGASGFVLTVIMCKAMNRNIANVLFSGLGATSEAADSADQGEVNPITVQDAYYILEAASNVAIVPGYGMAVAQAQHVVKELGDLLEENGAEVNYAIHPVAGRMPGHMNVLLAEADVSYDQLREMDDINPIMPMVDVAIVIGANDVVNPAAETDQGSPIYGMPIIRVQEAKTTFVLKRTMATGFAGVQNNLFFMPNTRMLFGDAKQSIGALVSEFKES
jgi:NAD(P) transhydrogenase subunit beta